MTMTTMIAGARGRAAIDLGWAVRGALAAVADYRRIRREIAYLLQQDERMLSDIGLSRWDVTRAVRGRYC
jgi:uncharacterized protein YjiS (DUF1127 family)